MLYCRRGRRRRGERYEIMEALRQSVFSVPRCSLPEPNLVNDTHCTHTFFLSDSTFGVFGNSTNDKCYADLKSDMKYMIK